ncbi:NUMOD4 domain-containing protein [Clostridium cuniculi]|uniref:NUMOD4 domain-containing protein n=1 Tax=Clostridium cuniculi TaxID=2548455 RepID=UPI0018A8D80D|nr:NUMOD4 domain-containing protein [Clostridium cuniculi]
MNEIWKDIKGYEGIYQVSNFGRVKSLSRYRRSKNCYAFVSEKIRKLSKDKNGYSIINLNNNGVSKTHKIHRLVMFAFNEKDYFEGAEVNHIDEDKTNNKIDNLEWCTSKYNSEYSLNKTVICVTTGIVFKSLKEGAKYYGLDDRRISECCKGKKKYCRLKDGTKLVWSFFYEENEVV